MSIKPNPREISVSSLARGFVVTLNSDIGERRHMILLSRSIATACWTDDADGVAHIVVHGGYGV